MEKNSVIIKFDFSVEQTLGQITKVVGLVKAKYLIPVIDVLNLEANPRSSKTGPVTDAIQDSIKNEPDIFPFKTKGILLASSKYERLDRGRIKITPDNQKIEGILDGGHNTLAIGLCILRDSMDYMGIPYPKGKKNWDSFKQLWQVNREAIEVYQNACRRDSSIGNLNFYIPVELLVPKDAEDYESVESFKNDLLEICEARNNNVELPPSGKDNQRGFFDDLKSLMEKKDPALFNRIEWKPNDGGDIKVRDIIALAWIPLALISPVKDDKGRTIEPVSAENLYSQKSSCLKQFEKMMSSPDVTNETSIDYRRELKNSEVLSAFKIAVEIPELYDFIFQKFPDLYNSAGGSYGGIKAVKTTTEKNKNNKKTPFTGLDVEYVSPEGFIVPLVYGLQAIMEKRVVNGKSEIYWAQPPKSFLENNLEAIVTQYAGLLKLCDYDPQKVGKNAQCYSQALAAYKMAKAGLLSTNR